MCGIAGWIDFNQNISNSDEILLKISETLKRRGPDAEGMYKSERACLVHRRLIVIDPENGSQPMMRSSKGSEYIITYNGELYNTEGLRLELLKRGYEFQGHSDTEVLLLSFIEWGEAAAEMLNGIYALGIWNTKEQSLFLLRDRIGVKPLFYTLYEGGLIFGSEIKALLAHPYVEPAVTQEGLAEIFMLGPGRTPGAGIFKDIYELKPGQYAVFDRSGLKIKNYWSIKAQEHTLGTDETVEYIRELLIDAIRRQLVSDVPLCTFLSGGLDSSIISKVASDEYRKNGRRLTTYSVDYTDNQKYFKSDLFQPDSDKKYISIMTDFIDFEHRNVIIDNTELCSALYDALCARDLPGMADIDSSLLLFCREVKKDFTVAVSGECADEVFGGYPWYHNRDILFKPTFPWSQSLDLRKSIVKKGLFKIDVDEYVRSRYEETVNSAEKLPTDSPLDMRMREMFLLNFYWFMQCLLDRKDRMSMYHGLEVRVPFCDHRIVEFAYNVPWKTKSLGGREKGLVRKAFESLLPEEVVWRKKSPYPKTHNPVYLEAVRAEIRRILDNKDSPIYELIDADEVRKISDNPHSITHPWYGQLMKGPQILAYLIQVNYWMEKYKIKII